MVSTQSVLNKIFVAIVEKIDRRVRWDRFPTPLALVMLKGIRDNLRWNNLFDTNDAASSPRCRPPSAAPTSSARTVDGAVQRPRRPRDGDGGHAVRPQRATRAHPAGAGRPADDAQPAEVSTSAARARAPR